MPKNIKAKDNMVVYQTKSGALELQGDFTKDTVWATQAQMAEIFGVTPQNITMHIRSVYNEGELIKSRTCKQSLQVQLEGKRKVERKIQLYNLDMMISVGYRINSVIGTHFRQWATRTLKQHITEGYTIDPKRVLKNYEAFVEAVTKVRALLPDKSEVEARDVLELVRIFADTWFALDAYDKEALGAKKVNKKKVRLTADDLKAGISVLKQDLQNRGEATENFAQERNNENLEGIVGNVMQSFGGKEVYPSVEAKATHLLYFVIKNHPFVDGNKRSAAFAFVWFLEKVKVLNTKQLTPSALTALTILIAESNPADKEKITSLVMSLITKG
ncbi:virulence RhuM family protein [Candidatus Kaiserbacteria bacterium]|nr:virulence RhuM family protein [Candidatus Kaiserbacteria bacterium]